MTSEGASACSGGRVPARSGAASLRAGVRGRETSAARGRRPSAGRRRPAAWVGEERSWRRPNRDMRHRERRSAPSRTMSVGADANSDELELGGTCEQLGAELRRRRGERRLKQLPHDPERKLALELSASRGQHLELARGRALALRPTALSCRSRRSPRRQPDDLAGAGRGFEHRRQCGDLRLALQQQNRLSTGHLQLVTRHRTQRRRGSVERLTDERAPVTASRRNSQARRRAVTSAYRSTPLAPKFVNLSSMFAEIDVRADQPGNGPDRRVCDCPPNCSRDSLVARARAPAEPRRRGR